MSKNRFTCPDGTDIRMNKLVGVSPLVITSKECSFKLYMENIIVPVDIIIQIRRSESFDAKVFKDCILLQGKTGSFKYELPDRIDLDSVWIDAMESCSKAFYPPIDVVTIASCQLISTDSDIADNIASVADKAKSLSVVGKLMAESREALVSRL